MKVHHLTRKEVRKIEKLQRDGINLLSAVQEACHLDEDAYDIEIEGLVEPGAPVTYELGESSPAEQLPWRED